MSEKKDLNISGASVMPGGDYGRVRISGSGKINGDLRAEMLRCSGAAQIQGNTVTEELDCSGVCSVVGNLEAKESHVSGSLKVRGSVSGGNFNMSGGLKVEDGFHCQRLKLSGGLYVGRGMEAEQVELSGGIRVGTLLNAETITIRSQCSSRVQEIGCSSLRVRKEDSSFFTRLFRTPRPSYALEVDTIEADQADLEYTRANVVRGRDVVIGPGCRIRRVEYTGTCRAPEGAVAELVKV